MIGINFEDRVVGAIRKAAEKKRVDFFVNARTDVFFEHSEDAAQAVDEALERDKAYAAAGASGFFIPGLTQEALIGSFAKPSHYL